MNNYLPKNLDFSAKEVSINKTSLLSLAEKHGTPLYVYDWKHILDNLAYFRESFGEETIFRYAAKAFICKAFVKELQTQGWGTDVVSGGEMSTVKESIGTLETSLFNGTFKSKEELFYFIKNKGGHISIDNRTEVEEIDKVSSELGIKQNVLIRLNLDLGAETHPMVLTSGQKQQFGISPTHAEEVVEKIHNLNNLNLEGVHVHIGSQIKDPQKYFMAMETSGSFLTRVIDKIEKEPIFNAGGGFFSPYAGDNFDEDLSAYNDAINSGIKKSWGSDYRLMVEPGRAIVNNPGVILYTTGAIKSDRGEKPYILVDGGMSDNPRPALYGSEHKLFNISNNSGQKKIFAVSGRHCESGDLLVENADLPSETKKGDILMSTSTGAYTYSMASNYNRVPKPAVVSVKEDSSELIVNKQRFEEVFLNDV